MNMIKDGRVFSTTAEYAKKLKGKDESALFFIRQDAHNAAKAMPDAPNASFYREEERLCEAEIRRRAVDAG